MKSDSQKTLFIRIGDFFFKYRNRAFPIILIGVFALIHPTRDLFASQALEGIKDIIGVLIAVSGLAVRGIVIGYAYIKRGGLNKRVYADKLVTEGMFTLCRNPLYVGNMLIYAGVFLVHGSLPLLIGGTLFFYGIYMSIIAAEEYFLKNKFGKQYDTYAAVTPRWLPVLSRFKGATKDMEFSFRRVLLKDYPAIANTAITLILMELYENITYPADIAEISSPVLIGAIIAFLAAALGVRYCKKRGLITE